jgi:hypothetical protein
LFQHDWRFCPELRADRRHATVTTAGLTQMSSNDFGLEVDSSPPILGCLGRRSVLRQSLEVEYREGSIRGLDDAFVLERLYRGIDPLP